MPESLTRVRRYLRLDHSKGSCDLQSLLDTCDLMQEAIQEIEDRLRRGETLEGVIEDLVAKQVQLIVRRLADMESVGVEGCVNLLLEGEPAGYVLVSSGTWEGMLRRLSGGDRPT